MFKMSLDQTQIMKSVLNFRLVNKRDKSIQHHLRRLGVPKHILYVNKNHNKARSGTLYERMDSWDIMQLAKEYYREAMWHYHPDMGYSNKTISQKINEAYSGVKRILSHHPSQW